MPNKMTHKILIFQPILTIKVYKYAKILSKYFKVDVGYTKYNFDKNYNLNTNFINKFILVKNIESLINDYYYIIFKDINTILMNIYDKYRDKILILICDVYFCRSNNKEYVNKEINFLKKIDYNHVIFSGYFIKRQVQILKINISKSLVIPNVPLIENIPDKKLIKLSTIDNKYHIVYCGTLQTGNNHRNYKNIVEKINKYNNIILHIIPTKHDGYNDYIKPNLKNIKIHNTQPHETLHKYLTQFDIGFVYYSLEYSDKDYINLSEGNKFYDYLFAGLPIIANNSVSYNYLVNKYKCGICIKSLDNLDKICNDIKNININFDCCKNSLDYYIENNQQRFMIN